MFARLNLVDRLYLFYLTAVAGLAIWGSHSVLRIALAHCAIALLIVLLAMNAHRSKVIRFLHDWYPLAMFIFSFEEIARFSLALAPHWQDASIIAFEQRVFSTSPDFWAKHGSRLLSEIMDLGYFSYYPLFPIVAGCLYAREERRPFHQLVLAAVWMYLISFCVYLAFPLEGPRRALPGFHAPPPGWLFTAIVGVIQSGAGVRGNALPSSHVALALLCAFSAQRWLPRLAPFAWTALCLICLGAVYDGYHYFSDVLAGLLAALTSSRLSSLTVSLSCKIEQPTRPRFS
ncbi:MAG TPA: phosphatase PAP2 family protein [Candidatus Angelobacter sp.]|nr:phosphatase PAP2 family protein [Candidatus Angelobacter sp.]